MNVLVWKREVRQARHIFSGYEIGNQHKRAGFLIRGINDANAPHFHASPYGARRAGLQTIANPREQHLIVGHQAGDACISSGSSTSAKLGDKSQSKVGLARTRYASQEHAAPAQRNAGAVNQKLTTL